MHTERKKKSSQERFSLEVHVCVVDSFSSDILTIVLTFTFCALAFFGVSYKSGCVPLSCCLGNLTKSSGGSADLHGREHVAVRLAHPAVTFSPEALAFERHVTAGAFGALVWVHQILCVVL